MKQDWKDVNHCVNWVINSKGKPWIFIIKTDATAEAPILWSPDAKSQLIGKDPGAEKDWRQEEKGMTEDEMVGWHHRVNGHEFEQTQGDSVGQGTLACCSPWACQESDTTKWLNNKSLCKLGDSYMELSILFYFCVYVEISEIKF